MALRPEGAGGGRRRGGSSPNQQPAQGDATPPEGQGPEPGQDPENAVLSRTIFSFLDPSLDFIASFGAPFVIAGIVGLVSGVVVVAFVGSMATYGWINIGIGGGLILLVALISLSTVVAAFVSRTGRYGVNTIIMVAAFTGLIVVVNVLSFENKSRLDVTATNQFSLADRSKQILEDLDQSVRATAFYITDFRQDQDLISRHAKVADTLQAFASRNSKFSYRFVDPDLKPDIANKYFGSTPSVFVGESIVIESQDSGSTDVVERTDATYQQLEQDLVTSILVVTGREQKTIYFLADHGERSISSQAPDGYRSIASGLESDNYRLQLLVWDNLTEDVFIPDDAALLIIARPTTELPDSHAQALHLFLQGKNPDGSNRRESGRLVFLGEPDTPASFKDFMLTWGVILDSRYIRDVDRSVPGVPYTLLLGAYHREAPLEIIIPRGEPLQAVFMPGATALHLPNDDLRASIPLAGTSPNSFLISDVERTEPITDGADADPRGPFSPAVIVRAIGPVGGTAPTSQVDESAISSLMVFGDSDFISNANVSRGSGADLFLNSVNYLLGDYSLVSIRPKAFPFREFNLDRNEHNFVRFSSWLFLPGLLGLMAAFVWWVRR